MNVIKDGGGTAAMRDKLNKEGEVMKVGMQRQKDHERSSLAVLLFNFKLY